MRSRVSVVVVLSLCVEVLSGCFIHPTVSAERHRQASQLVDQGTKDIREGRLKEANSAFSMAEELAPIAAAVDGQGCVALLFGEFDRAERLFKRAYDMDDTYDQSLANLALLMDIQGRHAEASRLYDEVMKVLPESVAARNNRAALEYDGGGRKMEVLHELRKANLIADHHVVRENLSRLGGPMPVPTEYLGVSSCPAHTSCSAQGG
jgi:Flp pilus assembly protein TadD